jgi:hypothetical protein
VRASPLAPALDGGRPPKVKPSPSFCCGRKAVGDALGIGTPAREGGSSISWAPSSVIVLCGRAPGRGKNIERLREWRRECRRECVVVEGDSGGSIPFEDRLVRVWAWARLPRGNSGRVTEEGRWVGLGGDEGTSWGGNDIERGDGEVGLNGLEVERVRRCRSVGVERVEGKRA